MYTQYRDIHSDLPDYIRMQRYYEQQVEISTSLPVMEGGHDVYDRFYTPPYFASMTSHAQQPIHQQQSHQQQSPQRPISGGEDASFTRGYRGNTCDVYSLTQITDRHSIHSRTPPEHVYTSQQSYGTDRPYYSNVQQVSLPSFSETFGECTEVPDSEEYLPEYTSHYQSTTDNYYFSDQHSGCPIHHVEHKPDKQYNVSSTCSSGPSIHNAEHGHFSLPHDEDKQYHTVSNSHRTHMPTLCMPT